MRIAVDALPINNLSGRHVLLGHLSKLAADHIGKHEFIVLHHRENRDICRDLGAHVTWVECAGIGSNWVQRLFWQSTCLQQLLQKIDADWIISTSGALVPGIRLPQIVLAQNPWCYFPQFHRSIADRIKASLQRIGYRAAQRRAKGLFYLSDYVAEIYKADADCQPAAGDILYVGIDESTFLAAASHRLSFDERSLEVLTVSAMARHKSVEDVVKAVAILHERAVPAHLTLVGPWNDSAYRTEITALIRQLGLSTHVTLTGKVSNAALHEYYRRARVFCLLSRCESFGIPAVEAQAFGTPSVVADICAPPEVAGPGGEIVPPDRVDLAADALQAMLTQSKTWAEYSARALKNSERFRWDRVSAPLSQFLSDLVLK